MIEVFHSDTIYNTYNDIVGLLNSKPDIEISVLQSLSYCFYEVLDNVLTHSERQCGTAIMCYLPENSKIQILVAMMVLVWLIHCVSMKSMHMLRKKRLSRYV